MIPLSLRIDRALIAVGNDSGSSSEKHRDQQDGEDRQAVHRQHADDRLAAAQRGQLRTRRLEGVRFQGLHRRSGTGSTLADAAARRFSAHRSSPDNSAATRPRWNTSARWQIFATSSKSVETMQNRGAARRARRRTAGRSLPSRQRRRRRSDPRTRRSLALRCSQRPTTTFC